jgi:hypothetical protein
MMQQGIQGVHMLLENQLQDLLVSQNVLHLHCVWTCQHMWVHCLSGRRTHLWGWFKMASWIHLQTMWDPHTADVSGVLFQRGFYVVHRSGWMGCSGWNINAKTMSPEAVPSGAL